MWASNQPQLKLTLKDYGLKVCLLIIFLVILFIFFIIQFCNSYSEGGRLEKEMKYIRTTLGEGFGSTNQIVIQTPKATGANVLHANALLFHLEAMKVATKVTVEMFEV